MLPATKSPPFGGKYKEIKETTITIAMIAKMPRPTHIIHRGTHANGELKKEGHERE
jgi:hypothetical protein